MDRRSFEDQINEMREAMVSIQDAIATHMRQREIVRRIAAVQDNNEEELVAILSLTYKRGYPLTAFKELEAHFAKNNMFKLARIVNTHIDYNFNP
jgi:hypothetical protein